MGWLSPPPLVFVLFLKIFIVEPSICFSHPPSRLAWVRSHGGGRSAKASKVSHVKGKKECTSSVETSLGLLFAKISLARASVKAKPESEQGVVTKLQGRGYGEMETILEATDALNLPQLPMIKNQAISCFNIPYNYPLCSEHSGQAKHSRPTYHKWSGVPAPLPSCHCLK